MDEELRLRQQIEREYHNLKYKNDPVPSPSGQLDAAYRFYQGIIDRFPIGRILDFGCGDGWVSIDLARHGHEVYGIDISIELVNRARKWAQELGISHQVHFDEMTGENLLFQDNFFDAVVGSAILHHTDFNLALDNIRRVLKPGGKGLFIEPMNHNILLKIWRVFTPWRRSSTERALTLREINMISRIFPEARLKYFILTSIFTRGLMTIFPRINFLKTVNQILEKIDDNLINQFPKLGKSCAVVVIELIKEESQT